VILHVTQSGRVDDARLERSSGSRQLDRAALEAFRKWRFQELPAGSAPGGRWLRTEQRFILYQFMYSRLAVGAAESVYAEHLKPKPGTADEQTPASQGALLGFVARTRAGALTDPDAAERGRITQLRDALQAWGEVKAVRFIGVAGSNRWMSHEIRRDLARGAGRAVEVSWNMFEMRHEHGTSEWLIATDRDGEVWAARAGRAPDAPTGPR
jgi:TonB family protein